MKLTETNEDGFLVLTDGTRKFEMDLSAWGNPSVYMDEKPIPSARIWELVLDALEAGRRVDRPTLFAEAERASMYAQKTVHMFLWTLDPDPGRDEPLGSNVYWHRDTARSRPLVDRLGLVAARLDPAQAAIPANLEDLFQVAADRGFYPVGGTDNKYYFAENPAEVYRRLHCGPSDWPKIMKMARRPGQHGYKVDLKQMMEA